LSANVEKVRLKIRLTKEEKAKLEHDAALCGLTQSEYLRQLSLGRRPRPKQPPEFWELLNALYDVHDKLEQLTAYCPEAAEECSRLERLVLSLQGAEMGPPQSHAALWGEEHPRNGELALGFGVERSIHEMVSFRRWRRKR